MPGASAPPRVGSRFYFRGRRTPHPPRRCRRRGGGTRPGVGAPRQHGARVDFDPARGGYAVDVDERYGTSAAGVFACGDVTGYVGTGAAARAGAEAGRLAAASLAAAICGAIVAMGAVGCASTPASPPAATPPIPTGPPAPSAPVEPPPFAGGLPPPAKGWPTRAPPPVERSSTPPGARCVTSTSIRSWVVSIGRRSVPNTSRWPLAPRRTLPSTAC